jgi:surfeit locus 1 family protein
MRRLPILPTIVVAAAVAVMVALGVWQLQRAQWKEALIAEAERRGAVTFAPIACSIDAAPEVRAGRSRSGQTGYRYLVPCGGGSDARIDIGWAPRPDALPRASFQGELQATPELGNAKLLIARDSLPPLAPSRLPTIGDIPNNHLMYAFQWFFFAVTAAVIYALALRRRRRSVAPGPAGS